MEDRFDWAGAAHALAPAKLTLCLHILSQLPDGYHEVEILFDFIDLADALWLAPGNDQHQVHYAGRFGAALERELRGAPQDLTVRAIHWFDQQFGVRTPPLRLQVAKEIPFAAGLGGGSADAAAMIRLLLRLHRIAEPLVDLAPRTAALGADVPACLLSRPMIGGGIGDQLRSVTLALDGAFLIVTPPIALPTASVFEAYARARPDAPARRTSLQRATITTDDLAGLQNHLWSAAASLAPEIHNYSQLMQESDSAGPCRLAGSGPTLWCYFSSHSKAMDASVKVQSYNPAAFTRVCRRLAEGPSS